MSAPIFTAEHQKQTRTVRIGVVVAAFVVCLWGAFQWPASFWPGYLAAAVFWTSVSLGCLALSLLHPLTGGRWGWAIIRELHAGLGAIVLTGVFLIPIVFAAEWIYPWARSLSHLNEHQQRYLAPGWVLMRMLTAWFVWLVLAAWLIRGLLRTDRSPGFHVSARKSAFGLILFWITATSASVDGLMSLDPRWTSSMFGVIQVIGGVVAGLAWVLISRRRIVTSNAEEEQVSHDLGNLLFAFNLVWVYLSFSQYLIIWAADLPHEVAWYFQRQHGIPGVVGTALLVLHFVIPFAVLLSVDLKRQPKRLAQVAGLLLVMRVVDLGWTVFPSCPDADWRASVGLAASVLLLGVIWITVYEQLAARVPSVTAGTVADGSVSAGSVPLAESATAAHSLEEAP